MERNGSKRCDMKGLERGSVLIKCEIDGVVSYNECDS